MKGFMTLFRRISWQGATLLVVFVLWTQVVAVTPPSNPPVPGEKSKNNSESQTQQGGGLATRTFQTIFQYHRTSLFGQPHTFNVFPLVYWHLQTGLNLGLRTLLISTRRRPYQYQLYLQFLGSVTGGQRHKIILDYPRIGDSAFGIYAEGVWERDLLARYFGLGNNSVYQKAFTNKNDDRFVDEDYYLYNLKRPRFTVYGTLELLPQVVFWFGFGMEFIKPQLKDVPENSFFAQDQPFGYLGGTDRHFSFRLSWDTRKNKVFPTRGFLTEVSLEPTNSSVEEELQTARGTITRSRSVSYYRYTFSDAHFIPLHANSLIFANRFAFEAINGEAPYYAYIEVAGERRSRSLGGSQSLRGFQSRRFLDKIRFFTLTELRYNYRKIHLMGQSIDLIFAVFFDTGRVWHSWSEIAFNDFHRTFGGGVWMNWNNRFIVRLDIGRSEEDIIPYFRMNTAF
ncbi:MAG: BamA/TamA family outer membrane protein [bacterium]